MFLLICFVRNFCYCLGVILICSLHMYSDTSCPVTALHLLWYIVLILYEE